MHKIRRAYVYAFLGGGIVIVSTAAILIRLAQGEGASSLLIATVRLSVAALILSVPVLTTQRAAVCALSRRDLVLATVAGIALALHFGCWIRSLEFTSVAASTVLVTTNPLWVGVASMLVFHERLRWQVLAGIALTVVGTAQIFLLDSTTADSVTSSAHGNLLALAGAVCMSVYLLVGRSLRGKLPLFVYAWLVYSVAAIALLATAVATEQSVQGFGRHAIIFMLALAIGPQLLGHTILNWALRHVSATFVALSVLGEPIGSALLALVLFGESMSVAQLLTYGIILTGIALSALGEAKQEPAI